MHLLDKKEMTHNLVLLALYACDKCDIIVSDLSASNGECAG